MVTASSIKRAVKGSTPERVSELAGILNDSADSCVSKTSVENAGDEQGHTCYVNIFACGGYYGNHTFSPGIYFLGRSKDMDVVVSTDRSVSRCHAVITVHPDGSATIRDAVSAQGLFVNGQQVYRHELKDGDIVAMGWYTLNFHTLVPPKKQTEAEEIAKDTGSKINLLPVAVDTTVAMMIVDRSRSMGRFGEAPQDAINAYVHSLRESGQNFYCGVTSFAGTTRVEIPLTAVGEIGKFDNYSTSAGTLLYATVNEALKECLALKQKMEADNRPLRVIIGVFSDGEDNLSPAGCQSDLQKASAFAIEAGFELLAFGIGIDAKELAYDLGFPSDYAETFEASEEGIHYASASMSHTSTMKFKVWNAAGQNVECKVCHRKYICTPKEDYYNSTCPTDGVCEPCLLKGHK